MQTIYDAIKYLFNPLPTGDNSYYIPLAVLTLIFLAISFLIRFQIKKNKENKTFRRMFRAFPSKLETIAGITIIYMLCLYYRLAFLSTRILIIGTLLIGCYIVYKLARSYIKEYPVEKKRHAEQLEKNKYIPGKKRK
jgi:uncharacterized membrane protein SirB2